MSKKTTLDLPENIRLLLEKHRLKFKSKYQKTTLEKEDDKKENAVTMKKKSKPKKKQIKMSNYYLQYLLCSLTDPDQKVCCMLLFFLPECNINKDIIENAIKESTVLKDPDQEGIYLDILIILNKITPPAKRSMMELVEKTNQAKKNYIAVIFRSELAWDKSKSIYTQHYSRIPKEEADKFMKEHMYKDIPKMVTTDPMVSQYGFQVGDIVYAEESQTYRLVIVETVVESQPSIIEVDNQ
jgi:DNA-directed RNA polymerase subunit H (RpoH/RPB5)